MHEWLIQFGDWAADPDGGTQPHSLFHCELEKHYIGLRGVIMNSLINCIYYGNICVIVSVERSLVNMYWG